MKFRRVIFPLLCALFIWFAWKNQSQASALLQVLRGAQVLPILIAATFQIGTLFNQPALFQTLYNLVGIGAKWRELAPVVLAGRFVNVVTPAGGLGETALLFEQARRRGWDTGKIALVTTLYFALNFAVFVVILVAGFGVLATHGDLKGYEVLAALPLFIGLGGGALVLWNLAQKPERLQIWALKLAGRLSARFVRVSGALQSTGEAAKSFATSLQELRGSKGGWSRPIIHAILVDALEIAVLAACFAAFGVVVSAPLLIAGYVVGTLFTIVSLTPQGVGAVEGAMGATLVSMGVSLPHATAIILAYRGLSFWMPLLVGLIATRFWTKSLTHPETSTAALRSVTPRH